QLEYITATADAPSLSLAADRLGVSQPSLSVALTQVEAHLGQKLFDRRRGRSIRLTPFGRDFIQRARHLLSQAAALTDPADARMQAESSLTLGCFNDLAPLCIGPATRALREAFPGLRLTYLVADFTSLAEALRQGQIDLAITYDIGLDSRFQRHVWGGLQPSAFLAPDHKLASRQSLRLRDIATDPLILFEEALSLRHVLGLFKMQGVTPFVAHRVGSLELMRSLAANGDGVGISYTTPPGNQSYDGKPLVARMITDAAAAEQVLIVAAQTPEAEARIGQVITALKSSTFPG
ncbi:LysR family transcriptional regulator, partial [Pseudorhodobacter sp.]|uniref:LysR family transcriptional regulator n=1 Tax=Pseudorhodobacter sp. TaxID=1934400 RepID=UPI00264A165E